MKGNPLLVMMKSFFPAATRFSSRVLVLDPRSRNRSVTMETTHGGKQDNTQGAGCKSCSFKKNTVFFNLWEKNVLVIISWIRFNFLMFYITLKIIKKPKLGKMYILTRVNCLHVFPLSTKRVIICDLIILVRAIITSATFMFTTKFQQTF